MVLAIILSFIGGYSAGIILMCILALAKDEGEHNGKKEK